MSAEHLLKYQPIVGEEGSFAQFTILQRLPVILERIMEDFRAEPNIVSRVQSFREDMIHGKIEKLPVSGPDIEVWGNYIQPYFGKSWFEVPFYFAETYFYRMILDAVDYFTTGIDPFARQKDGEIQSNLEVMAKMAYEMEDKAGQDVAQFIEELINLNLWGNKADLSQLDIHKSGKEDYQTIVDDTKTLIEFLQVGINRLDIVLDNSGLELFTDILLSTWMLRLDLVKKVVFHTKAFPTFVSDATNKDVHILINFLANQEIELSNLFMNYQQQGQINIVDNEFWNRPHHFYEMPKDLNESLKHSDMVVFKGDANYRRIFGDRMIPSTTPLNLLTNYLPAKSVAIRILKSEIMVGLSHLKFHELNKNHPDWMISGKFGIVQLLN